MLANTPAMLLLILHSSKRMYLSVTEPSRLHSLRNDIIYKSVHTSNGVLIGNIGEIASDPVIVKADMLSTAYYHIPIEKVREWDGHALWLTMDDKESRKHILTSHTLFIEKHYANRNICI